MNLVKSRLTRLSRASGISFPQVAMMNKIMNGIVYDWATVLAEHYTIGLFLDATVWMIPLDRLEVKPGLLGLEEPLIM